MWYRISQNISRNEVTKAPFEEAKIKTHPVVPSYNPEPTVSAPTFVHKPFKPKMTLAEFEEDVEENFKKLIGALQPSNQFREFFVSRFNQMKSMSSDKKTELTSKDYNRLKDGYDNLFQMMNKEIEKQAVIGLKKIVSDRNAGYYDNQLQDFVSTDKVLQNYLGAQMNDDFISAVNLGEDITEIARFFIMNSSDPKLDKIKFILKRIKPAGWSIDVISLITSFYINYKLSELVNLVQQRQPKTFEDETLIALLQSKIAVNSMKIGVSLNNILNRNQFGQLLGQIGSTAIQGVEGLQNLMNTNRDITDLIYSTPAKKPR